MPGKRPSGAQAVRAEPGCAAFRGAGRGRAGRYPHDGRRLRVRCTRPAVGHAGAVPYSRARGARRGSASLRGARHGRAGRHPHDGRRLRVRCTRHNRGHAGAVPYSGPRGAGRGRAGAPGCAAFRGAGRGRAGGEASSRRAASPRAVYPAQPWARRSRALQHGRGARGGRGTWVRVPPGRAARAGGEASSRRAASPRAVYPAQPWARRSRALRLGARPTGAWGAGGRGGILTTGGVSACGVPGTTVGTPEPCPTAGCAAHRGARRGRAGWHSHDGRRLRVRCTRHNRGHAGAVPYSRARGARRVSASLRGADTI